jgi:MFS family permease
MLKPVRPPRRLPALAALFAGAATMSAAMAVSGVVGTLVVAGLLGTAWGGLPNAAGVVATGLGALALTRLMVARGRRAGLLAGYVAAAAGGALAAAGLLAPAAVAAALVVAGMALLGAGNAAGQLSRYAAADLFPPHRRGLAIGVVVWSGTIGAVGGPLLLQPAEDAAAALGRPAAAGPFALAGIAAALAALAALAAPSRPGGVPGHRAVRPRDALRLVLATPAARTAFLVMATGQVVMTLVMTAVPLDLHHHGHGIGLVGAVLSAHTLGMFVLSPLTGRLIDAVGARRVMPAGLVLLVAGALPVALVDGARPLGVAVFGLGVGWNLCFVGGSGALARELPESGRAAAEGAVDAAVWCLSAVATLAATAVLAAGGIDALAVTATVTALAALAALAVTTVATVTRTGAPAAAPVSDRR